MSGCNGCMTRGIVNTDNDDLTLVVAEKYSCQQMFKNWQGSVENLSIVLCMNWIPMRKPGERYQNY